MNLKKICLFLLLLVITSPCWAGSKYESKISINCGPNVTIVTPVHPLLPGERRLMLGPDGQAAHLCYARPVVIGNDVWLGANVVVTGGVTIGDGCVIGAGSVVTRDIPPFSLAAGVPCRMIRQITEKDSMRFRPELLGGCAPMGE